VTFMAEITSLLALLEDCNLTQLREPLACETLETLVELERVALLAKLKTEGVAKLSDRQALANAIAKAKRAGRVKIGADDVAPGAASVAAATPTPPPPIAPMPPKLEAVAPTQMDTILVSFYSGGMTPTEGCNALKRWLAAASDAGLRESVVLNSPVDYPGTSTYEEYATALVADLDSDPSRAGRPCVIVGHSYGGVCAFALASKLGERCKALAIVGVRPPLGGALALSDAVWQCASPGAIASLPAKDLLKPLITVWRNRMLPETLLEEDEAAWPSNVSAMLELVRKQYSSSAMPIHSETVAALHGQNQLQKICAPILAVVAEAEADQAETREKLEDWRNMTTAAFRLEIIPRTDHFSIMQPILPPLPTGAAARTAPPPMKHLTPLYDLLVEYFRAAILPGAAPKQPAALPPHLPETPAAPAGVHRWIVDISTWDPGDAEWQLLLSLLPEVDSTKVMKFIYKADQKRALVSRLLQRRVCHEGTGLPYADVRIDRTKGGKPFMANKPAASAMAEAPNFNFNVSHEGKFVVLATEPWMLCGVDVAAPEEARGGKKKEFDDTLRMMTSQLTKAEMAVIERARPDVPRMEGLFRRFWSLKEAYTKGRGDGLGFEFGRCEFTLGEVGEGADGQKVQFATVVVDGKPLPQWRFYIQELDASHWISTARGPPSDVVDAHGAFKATFGMKYLLAPQAHAQLERAEPPFKRVAVEHLVPDDVRSKYVAQIVKDQLRGSDNGKSTS